MIVQAFIFLVTIYALLGDDLRVIYASKEEDYIFTQLTTFSLFVFLLEIIIASLVKPEYRFGFFFWLDLGSTLSLITDIDIVMQFLTGVEENSDMLSQTNQASIVRASRGARIGTRAGRLTRIIRLIRLIRIVKLYKSANLAISK